MRLRYLVILFVPLLSCKGIIAQPAEMLVQHVREKLEKVNNYEADARLKTNVSFIKAPVANVKIYYQRPDQVRIINQHGISFIPKGAANINLGSAIMNNKDFDILDAGKDNEGLRIIKLLPRNDTADIVLTTLYIDEKNLVIKKSKTTTRENGTYELQMNYGRYTAYGLPDKIVFTFNTKDYKLPKGVTLDYENGGRKEDKKLENKKGIVEIEYSNYTINKG